jgi:hypothetical protein
VGVCVSALFANAETHINHFNSEMKNKIEYIHMEMMKETVDFFLSSSSSPSDQEQQII